MRTHQKIATGGILLTLLTSTAVVLMTPDVVATRAVAGPAHAEVVPAEPHGGSGHSDDSGSDYIGWGDDWGVSYGPRVESSTSDDNDDSDDSGDTTVIHVTVPSSPATNGTDTGSGHGSNGDGDTTGGEGGTPDPEEPTPTPTPADPADDSAAEDLVKPVKPLVEGATSLVADTLGTIAAAVEKNLPKSR